MPEGRWGARHGVEHFERQGRAAFYGIFQRLGCGGGMNSNAIIFVIAITAISISEKSWGSYLSANLLLVMPKLDADLGIARKMSCVAFEFE